jgi:SprT protein
MDRLKEIEKQAKALMTAHGVGSLQFAYDRGKNRLGCTFHRHVPGVGFMPFKITLSKHFVEILPDEEIREIVLHEIAHAKAGHGAGHGPKWKAEARKLGIAGDRCARPSARPDRKVQAWCETCNCSGGTQHRLPLRVYLHKKCMKPLIWFKEGTRVDLYDMPVRYVNEYESMHNRGRI